MSFGYIVYTYRSCAVAPGNYLAAPHACAHPKEPARETWSCDSEGTVSVRVCGSPRGPQSLLQLTQTQLELVSGPRLEMAGEFV